MVKIKLKPDTWSHHHIHRLYHLSFGICFSFIAMTVLLGLVTTWLQARAQSQTELVTVMASVPQISPGPIIPSSGGGPGPASPPPQNTPSPGNSNSVNSPVPVSSVPTNSPVGTPVITGNAIFTPETVDKSLSIFLNIADPYKVVQPGQRVIADIKLVNNDPQHSPRLQNINYTIENSSHQIIVQATDAMTLDKSLAFSKVFLINSEATPDRNKLIVQIGEGPNVVAASDSFQIKVGSVPPVPAGAPELPFSTAIILSLLGLFAVIAAIAYHNVAALSAVIIKNPPL